MPDPAATTLLVAWAALEWHELRARRALWRLEVPRIAFEGLREGLLAELVLDGRGRLRRGARLVLESESELRVRFGDPGFPDMCLWTGPTAEGAAAALAARLEARVADGQRAELFVLLRDGPELRAQLEASFSGMGPLRRSLYHLAPGGRCWTPPAAAGPLRSEAAERRLGSALGRLCRSARRGTLPRLSASERALLRAGASERAVAEAPVEVLSPARGTATILTLAALALAHACQLHWQQGSWQSVAWHMGAFGPDGLAAGEVERLLASGLLHRGPGHLLSNAFVLWVLGRRLEGAIGGAGFVLLCGLSVLGGNLAKWLVYGLLRDAPYLSVGASGAAFGLLGAFLAFGVPRRETLDADRRLRWRRNGLRLLLLLLAASLAPEVSVAAHLGGAATGALLVGTGLLVPAAATSPAGWRRVRLQIGLGALTAGLALAAFALALARGRAWELGKPPARWSAATLGSTRLRIDLPERWRLVEAQDPVAGWRRFRLASVEPMMLHVRVRALPQGRDPSAVVRALAAELPRAAPPEGDSLESTSVVEEHGRSWLEQRFTLADGRQRLYQVLPLAGHMVELHVLLERGSTDAWREAARRPVRSLTLAAAAK